MSKLLNSGRLVRSALMVALVLLFCSTYIHMTPGKASAAIRCGDVLVAGSSWAGGSGVDVHSNAPYDGKVTSRGAKVTNMNASPPQWGWGWQCVELAARMYKAHGWNFPSGDAAQLYTNAANVGLTTMPYGSIILSKIVPGDMLVTHEGKYGHVMLVDSISGNTINVVDQNGADGGKTTVTYASTTKTISDGSNYQFSGVVHSPDDKLTNGSPTPSYPSCLGIVSSGQFLVKEGGLGSPWDNEYSGASAGVVSDNRIGVLTSSGDFLVKEGGLGSPWDDEHAGVKAGYVSGTRIGVLLQSGDLQVKDGGLGASWVDEYTGVAAAYLAGTRIGVLLANGTFLVKDGGLGNPWVTEYSNVVSAALSPNRIGVLTNTGDFLVKEGGLGATWVDEFSNVAIGYVTDGRVAVLVSGGTLLVKDQGLGGAWTTEYSGVANANLSGTRLGILLSNGNYLAKDNTLSDPWVNEYSTVAQGTVWSAT